MNSSFENKNWRSLLVLGIVLTIALMISTPEPALALGGAPVETYFVPLPVDDLDGTFADIGADYSGGDDIAVIITTSILLDGTTIYYDHWEDGYEADILNPTQGTTECWCDGDTGNGTAPNTGGTDNCPQGTAVIAQNFVPVPRNPANILFDGRDRIQVDFPVAVTFAAYPNAAGIFSLLAGATEVLDTALYGQSFVSPIGTNVGAADVTNAFQYTAISVMASEDNTEIFLNSVSQGTINRGEALLLEGLSVGDAILTTKPAQAHLLTGDLGSTYELRWYSLTPFEDWDDEYYTPVGDDTGPTVVWLYSNNPSPIVVDYQFAGSSGTVTVPANGVAKSPAVPDGSGAKFSSAGGNFYGFTQTDADGSGQLYDWGHPLVPADELSYQALVGLGFGTRNLLPAEPSRSVVFVTPLADADIYVTFKDGSTAGPIAVSALNTIELVGPVVGSIGEDMSAAFIQATTPGGTVGEDLVNIAVAYGQDPDLSGSGDPEALDFGTLVPPLPAVTANKSVTLLNDGDGNGAVSPGDTLRWTVNYINAGGQDIPAAVGPPPTGAFIIEDFGTPLFDFTNYVANSTTLDVGTGPVAVPDNANPTTLFPLDEGGIQLFDPEDDVFEIGDSHNYSFDVTIAAFDQLDPDPGEQICEINNNGELRVPNFPPFQTFAELARITYSPDISIEKTVYLGSGDNGAQCGTSAVDTVDGPIGFPITYCFEVTNEGDTYLTDINIDDDLLGNDIFDFAAAEPLLPGTSATGFVESTITSNSPVVNEATATAIAAYVDSQAITCEEYQFSDADTATTTPVTLSYFEATTEGDNVRFMWQTATETNNAGFNIYAETEKGRQQINEKIIRSHVMNAVTPQLYSYEAQYIAGAQFFLEDVDIRGKTTEYGPYEMGRSYGELAESQLIDWSAIRAEHEQKALLQAQRAALQVNEALQDGRGLERARTGSVGEINFLVNQDGIYRVTYDDLKQAGFDLRRVRSRHLALLNNGQPVPMYVKAGFRFREGSYIEFYGEALDTLYTDTNVYTLLVDRSLARRGRVAIDRSRVPSGQPAPFYMETERVENNSNYNFLSPIGDPWFETLMTDDDPNKPWRYDDLYVSNYVAGAAPAKLTISMWGASEWPWVSGPNHRVVTRFNGARVAEETFKGLVDASFAVELESGQVKEGWNSVTFTLPGTKEVGWSFVNLDSRSLTYPRAFVARDGELTFEAAGDLFEVTGLPSEEVVVFRIQGAKVARLARVEVARDGAGFSATFAGNGDLAKYVVVAADQGLKTPVIEPGRAHKDISSGRADYLIISHPDFKDELGDLIAAREAQGLSVRVTDVQDVYAQYGHGIFGPQAIKDYLVDVVDEMGVKYVLLVGGDTYDYRDYLKVGSISFIPSFYGSTGDYSQFVPLDPWYADLNDDGVPDELALGRLPVRNSAELASVIKKTLEYENKNYNKTALLAADQGFAADGDAFASKMTDWLVQKQFLDEPDLNEDKARAAVIAAINKGTALVSYVGHSGPTEWGYPSMFKASDVAALSNREKPTVVTQWGCWNTYYVDPSLNTMAHKLLVEGDNGAAVVLGATGVSYAGSERMLGQLLTPAMIAEGVSLGEAMQLAKGELGANHPHLVDVLFGWTILGDPATVVQP